MNKSANKYHPLISRFYRSSKWDEARKITIQKANGLCEKCGNVGTEVHHKIFLTPDNIGDVNITLNQENLIYLCVHCHNKEHKRFESKIKYKFDKNGDISNFGGAL